MGKKIRFIESRKESVSDGGQFHYGTTTRKEYNENHQLILESIHYEEAQNNGLTDNKVVKHYVDGKITKEVISNFDRTYQLDYKYSDNLEIVEKRTINVDNRSVSERLSEHTLTTVESLDIPLNYQSLKKIQSKRFDTDKLISVEKRFFENTNLVKIILEDYEKPSNSLETIIDYRDTTEEFDNNGLFIKEVTKKQGVKISEKSIHREINESESLCYFNELGTVQLLEHRFRFTFGHNETEVLTKYEILEDNKFQVNYLELTIINNEIYNQNIKFNIDYSNQYENGKVFDTIQEIPLFQMFDTKEEVLNKFESLFSKSDFCNFNYEKFAQNKPIIEEHTTFQVKDLFQSLEDVIPNTLEFENILSKLKNGSGSFNYINASFSSVNQDYLIRISNNEKCGYYTVGYF